MAENYYTFSDSKNGDSDYVAWPASPVVLLISKNVPRLWKECVGEFSSRVITIKNLTIPVDFKNKTIAFVQVFGICD